jgi:hypothetical protein
MKRYEKPPAVRSVEDRMRAKIAEETSRDTNAVVLVHRP